MPVTEFADYHRAIKGVKANPSARVNDAIFGTGASIKAKAFDEAVALMN